MFQADSLAETLNATLFQRADNRLEALLAQNGAQDPSELPRPLQLELLERAMLEAAASISPTGVEMLRHIFRAFNHPAFVDAMDRMKLSCRSAGNAFQAVRGIHAAVVLAGFGLPVAPFDEDFRHLKAKPSKDIDAVVAMFSADKGAFVAYNTCEAPFYLLLTDCIITLRHLVPVHPGLAEMRELLARRGASLPPEPDQLFTPAMAMYGREAGDAISSVALIDLDPSSGGSIVLYAGWQLDGGAHGCQNDGYVPVPRQLLKAVVSDPRYACPFWLNGGAPKVVH
jgi:hypothetical protein